MGLPRHRLSIPAGLACALLMSAPGAAQTPSPPKAAPAPYSLPWQLRPALVGNSLRLDVSAGSWESGDSRSGDTVVAGLIGSRRISSRVALLGRVSFIDNHPPANGAERSGSAISNPLLGATFLITRPGGVRRALFAGLTLPVGSGGGDSPGPAQTAALSRAIATRSAMDNALFAVNYFTLVGGASVARVTPRATVQAEATLLQLFRTRGPVTQDRRRTNFTAGLHVGRSFRPVVSAGAELRYQRWLTDAAPVRANRAARETVTLAFGPRFHFRLGGSRWIRPGLSLTFPLDEPLSGQRYRTAQIDVPVSF